MAGAGDFWGCARGVGSARFARSAADGQAGWAPLAARRAGFFRFCEGQKQKMWQKCLDVDRVDRETQTSFYKV